MLLIFVFFLFINNNILLALDRYVKTDGTDAGLGTSWAIAWKTLTYAAANINAGDTVYVTNGTYNETVTIQDDNVKFIGCGNAVIVDGQDSRSYGFRIVTHNNVKIENFEILQNEIAMISLNNCDNCVITNNDLHDNDAPVNNGCAIKLENGSDNNRIFNNKIYYIAANEWNHCYGIYLHNSHNNTIWSNDIYESGQAHIPGIQNPIPFHGIYVWNSDNNMIRYNHVHDMDQYGIHIIVDGAGSINTDNKILDNLVHGMAQCIVTENKPQWSKNNALNGQVIGRNKVYGCRVGIVWINTANVGDGAGGYLYKNSVSWSINSDSGAYCFVTTCWAKISARYNTAYGLYDGMHFGNNGHVVYNNLTYSNYNKNVLNAGDNGGPWSQTVRYHCAKNASKVGPNINWSTGSIYAKPLIVNNTNTRLQWNSPCIGAAEPIGGIRGCIGAHPSYLRAQDTTAGNTTTYTMVFVTGAYNESIPAGGKVTVQFPFGFSFSGPAVTSHTFGGSPSASVNGTTITFSPIGGSAPVNSPERIIFSGVVNPASSSSNYYCIITTYDATGNVIEKEESNNFRITGSAVVVNKGPYYVDDGAGASDLNPGTFSQPFRTIQKAANRMAPGVDVTSATTYIFPGNYTEQVEIYSNKNPGYIVFSALSNSKPIVTGSGSRSHVFFISNADNIIIKRLKITDADNGITLEGSATNNYFIKNTIYSNDDRGIWINHDSVRNNYFLTNDIYGLNQGWGININNGDNNTFKSNNIHNNQWDGVYINGSATGNKLINNTIYHNPWKGIGIWTEESDHNSIISNHIYDTYGAGGGHGIYIVWGDNQVISDNQIYTSDQKGVYIYNSTGSTLYNNIIFSNDIGVFITNGNNNIIRLNQIYHQQYGIYIKNNSISNYIIKNTIYSNTGNGIIINSDTADNNFILTNKIFDNEWQGIYIYESDYNTIYSNTIKNNLIEGILIEHNSIDNIIKKNTISYNTNGIRLHDNICFNTIVSNNIFKNDTEGIIIIKNSCYNKIYCNDISSNIFQGVRIISNANRNRIVNNNLWTNGEGIKIEVDSHTNSIISNHIFNNYWKGIYISGCRCNIIYSNIINNNKWEGVLIENNATQNIVTNNIISDNNEGVKIDGSDNNEIYFNHFRSNNFQAVRIINSDGIIINNNIMYTNGEGIKLDGNCNSGVIISNSIYNSTWKGIYIINSANIKILGNRIYRNNDTGIQVSGGGQNRITGNYILTNILNSGLKFESGANNNYCVSNIFAFNNNGIEVNNSTACTLYRNAVFNNNQHGILLDNSADNNAIINNSLSSNGQVAGDGIHLSVGLSGNIIKNSIIAFTRSGFGINDNTGGGSAVITYCDVFDNSSGGYGGAAGASTGCISADPLWISYNIYSSNFLYLQDISPCIDSGDPLDIPPANGGPVIDMGWKEHTRPYVVIRIIKSITNVKLGGGNRILIPGTTVEYKLNYKINGNKNATNIIIYDRVPHYSVYCTNNTNTAGGWVVEYSTNENPDQGYISGSYQTTYTTKDKVKWIRWKKPEESNTTNFLFFSVIIK